MQKKKKLTEKQIRKYVACLKGCPYCGSEDTEAGMPTVEWNQTYVPEGCNNCGRTWGAVYVLSNIIP